ncbi:MAG: hypothetical protein EBS89_04805, partial [Proteobacteria bacterium]|nr:hypothetical protein [Pseudomonadota bacterium]
MTTTTATADPIAFTSDAPGTLAPSPAPWVPWLFQAGNLCFWLSLYYYVPTLPNYARDLGAPLTVVGAMLSAYGIVQLVLRVPIL